MSSETSDLTPQVIAGAVASVNARDGSSGTLTEATAPSAAGLPYSILKQTHPTHDADYWRELRALYEGGKTLLRDDKVLNSLFPRHRGEHDALYRERQRRAFYVPYAAEILDHLVAGVTSDPVTMTMGGEREESEGLPPFYQDFVEDVSPDGGAKVALNELLADQLRTALQTCWSWTLVDLPPAVDESGQRVEYASLGDQDKEGALRAYAVALDPESVIDWEEDESGDLLWAMVRLVDQRRQTVMGSRSIVTERWTYYTQTGWARFEREREANKQFDDKDIIPLVAQGEHSFGRVPIVRLCLPRGLWAMNKMHGAAVEHFNKRSALAWGELQALLPELYEFLGPEGGTKGAMIGQAQEDAGRAVNQRRGQGFVQQRGHEDRAEFIGPNVAPFVEARNSCDSLRDDLHRVMHQMALSAANNAAALKRSAESKEQDRASVEIVLRDLGLAAKKHAEAILNMVSRGRLEEKLVDEWVAKGMSEFDAIAVSDSLKNALDIDMLAIESPTFRKRHRMQIVREVLEGRVKPEDLEQIEKELEENIDDESFKPGAELEVEVDRVKALGAAQPKPGASLKPGGNGKAKGEADAT